MQLNSAKPLDFDTVTKKVSPTQSALSNEMKHTWGRVLFLAPNGQKTAI